jgi:outer membrane autotransporter protein
LGVKYDRDGVSEGGDGIGLDVKGASHSYLTSNLGIRITKDYLNKNGDKRGGVMLGLSWMHQFSSTDFPVRAALQIAEPGTGRYTVYGTPLSSNSIGVQLGGYGRLSKNVLGFLNYNGNFSSNQKVHSITAGVEYEF